MSCIRTQINLVTALEQYESAETLARMFPTLWGPVADQRHARLCEIACACGFQPGRAHRHLTTLEWARQRAATLKRVFPNHCAEARKAA